MSFTPATTLPTAFYMFQWGSLSDPNPTLAAPLSPTDTTAYFSSSPKDHNGAVITGGFFLDVVNSSSQVMTCWIPAGAVDSSGKFATGIVQGVRLEGLDYTTSDPTLIPAEGFSAGDSIGCNISGVFGALIMGAIKGTIGTSGLGLTMGDGTNSNVTLSQTDASSTKGWIRKNPTLAKVQFSNDGTTWTNISDATASVIVKNSAADTTPGYVTDKLVAGAGVTLTTLNPGGNEQTSIATSSSGILATTALEAIAIGKPVAISATSGNVENLVASQLSSSYAGTPVAFDAGTVTYMKGFQAAANKVAVIYTESSNWYVIAGTVATDSKTITWGTRQSISSTVAATPPGGCYVSENEVVFTYVKSDNFAYARAASLVGTVFTFDTEVTLKGTGTNTCPTVDTVDTNKVMFAFNNSASFGRVSIGTLSGTVLTVDTADEQQFCSATCTNIAIAKAAAAKGFIVFSYSSKVGQVAISCGSTTPAPGSIVDLSANVANSIYARNISTDAVFIAWRDTTQNLTLARQASMSGTIVSNGTVITVSSVASATDVKCRVLKSTEAVVVWRDVTNSKGSFQPVSISGSTLATVGAAVDFVGAAIGATGGIAMAKVNDNAKFMILYVLNSTNDGTGIVYQDYINTDLYAGIAQSTVAAAASLSVRQVGLDTNQTGLTPGAVVNSNGIPIGKALTATSMEVTVSAPIISVSSGTSSATKIIQTGSDGRIDNSFKLSMYTGTGSDGDLSITSGVTTVDCGGARVVVKNYNSLSITGSGSLKFTNGASSGAVVIILIKGNCTLTSSSSSVIDVSTVGATGGAAVTGSGNVAASAGSNARFGLCLSPGATAGGAGVQGVAGGPVAFEALSYDAPYIDNALIAIGGGGGGGALSVTGTHTSGIGGNGAGCLWMIVGGAFNFTTGTINANGTNGTNGDGAPGCGGGGGGGAGMVIIRYNTLIANSGSIGIAGGQGGTNLTYAGGGGCGSVNQGGAYQGGGGYYNVTQIN